MAKSIFVGVNGVARKPKAIYVGVNGVAKKVKAVYVGVNNVAKKVYPGGIVPSNYTQLSYLDIRFQIENVGVQASIHPRIIIEFSIIGGLNYNNTAIFLDGMARTDAGSYISYNFAASHNISGFVSGYSKWITPKADADYYKEIRTNTTEGRLLNTNYKLDFLNGNNVYLYNSEGYYSISSNNLIGNYTKQSTPTDGSISENRIQLFGAWYETFSFAKIFNTKMYNGSTLIRDLYPCYRNSDQYLGYYDNVNKLFYVGNPGIPYHGNYATYDEAISNGFAVGSIV